MSRLIKKYKNRRLYDTEKSQFITIEELQGYVLDGIAFRVEDSKDGKDLTSATLMQIVVEMESGASQFLSPDVLRQLIVLSQHPMHKMFKEMLEKMFVSISQSGTMMEGKNPMLDAWQQSTQDMMNSWQSYFKNFKP